MHKHQLAILKNGLRLITVPMPHVESVTVMVGVGAGSRNETKRVNGLFHFIEHMTLKGTKKRPSTAGLIGQIDAVGGMLNAFTSKELTLYYVKLASKHTRLAFDILTDILTNSLFKPEEIEKEKGVIIEEINMIYDTPMTCVWEVFERLLYGDNPMGWNVGGEKESISQIKREDFLKYLDRLYFPKNMAIVVAGKLDRSEAEKLGEKYFGQLKRQGKKQIKAIKLFQNQSKTKLVFKKTEQTHFCLGVPGYWYSHPDRFALGALSAILGAGMSSRLFTEIREKRGLAYYITCSPEFYTDSGYLFAHAGVKLKKIEETIKLVLQEFQALAEKRVSLRELKKVKEMLKGHLILNLEDSRKVAGRYANQALLEEEIRTPQQTMKLIDKVTPEDVQRVAQDIFRIGRLNLALIGPYKSESRFKKLLKF